MWVPGAAKLFRRAAKRTIIRVAVSLLIADSGILAGGGGIIAANASGASYATCDG